MQKISNVSSLRDVFRNFENKFSNDDIKKVELTKSKPKLTKQYCNTLAQSFTKGVDSHFIRFYRNIRTGDSFGFSFPEDNNEEMIISIYHNSEKFFKNVNLDTLRAGLKKISKIPRLDEPPFDQIIRELFEEFDFDKQNIRSNVMLELSNILNDFSIANESLIEEIAESSATTHNHYKMFNEANAIVNQKTREFRAALEKEMNFEQIRINLENGYSKNKLLEIEIEKALQNNLDNSRKFYGISKGSYLNAMIEQLEKSSLKIKLLMMRILKNNR